MISKAAIMMLSDVMPASGFWTSAIPDGFSNTVQFLATGDTPGILQPGESFSVPIQYAGWQKPWDFSYPPINFKLGILDADNDAAVDWDSLKEEMRPESIADDIWEAIWTNFVSLAGTTWGDYVKMLTDNASYLSQLDQRVTNIGELLSFEFAQADALNVIRYLAASTDTHVSAPGADIVFRRVFPQSISGRYKLGAFGRSWSHNWNISLEVSDDGTVTIHESSGSRRIFQPDSRTEGEYFPMEGDHATLTDLGDGVFSIQEASGLMRTFSSDGKLDYVEDTNGNRITADYTNDLLTSLTHSSGQSLQLTYNADNLIETITDPDARVTTFTYDTDSEHLVSVEYFDGSTITYDYSDSADITNHHALTEITFPGGTHQYFTYDSQGRLETISKDGGTETINFSYNTTGKVSVTDTFGNTAKYCLDHRGILAKVTNPLGNATILKYDDEYNLTNIVNPAGHSHVYEYDEKGNLIYAADPLGYGTRFSYYGPFNRMTKLIDDKGNVTDYGYDDVGNLTSITYDDGNVESWAYDNQGNPTTWANRRGSSITYEYDTDGRLTAKILPDDSRIDYSYDARGNLTSATDSTGTTTLQYDANDRLEKITYPGDRFLQYTYNSAGQRESSVNQLDHRLDYHYDIVRRLEYITDETSAEIARYYYNAAGRLERKVLGNGVYTTYQYDAASQLTDLINYKPDDFILSKFVYTYDGRGRRTSMTTLEGQWDYEYDDLGQLIAWTAPDGRHVEYKYDALGNRVNVTDDGVVTDYTTNNMNQYTQVGDTTYEFDADGNLIQKTSLSGTTTYTYNDENRLVAVSSTGGNWTYTYDAFGNRVRVDDNGTTTNFVIDPIGFGDLVGEYNHDSGDLIAHYDHGFGLLSRTKAMGDSAFYGFDAIGNTSKLTNNAGATLNSYSYMPFGEQRSITETVDNSFEYVGEYGVMAEGSGFHYMRARFYDSNSGRFTTDDPIGLAGSDANLYRYVMNKPNYYIDPVGLEWIDYAKQSRDWDKILPEKLKNDPYEIYMDKINEPYRPWFTKPKGFLDLVNWSIKGEYWKVALKSLSEAFEMPPRSTLLDEPPIPSSG